MSVADPFGRAARAQRRAAAARARRIGRWIAGQLISVAVAGVTL
jgi:hypothetical protein